MAADLRRTADRALTPRYALWLQHPAMPDGLPPLTLPHLPFEIARPSRDPAPVDIVRLRWVLSVLLLLHILGAVLVDRAMQLQALPPAAAPQESIEIVFLDAAATAPAAVADAEPPATPPVVATLDAPAPVALPIRQALSRPQPPSPPNAMRAPVQPLAAPSAASPAPVVLDSLQLFNDDGSPRLSKQAIEAAQPLVAAPGFAPPKPQALAPIRSPIPYKPTRFDEYWVPSNESLGAEVMRRVIVEKEFRTPWGTRWRCAWIIILGGCGDVPPPAMKNPPKAPWETYQTEPQSPRAVDFLP